MLVSKGPAIIVQFFMVDKKCTPFPTSCPDHGVKDSQEAVKGAKIVKHYTVKPVEPCMAYRVEGESRPWDARVRPG